jgi:hypothetical protein
MYTSSYAPFNTTTDAAVRKIGLGLLSGALHVGMQQLNRSSSFVDPSTLITCGSSGYDYTRMVFGFTDSLQASAPIFIQVIFQNRANGPSSAPSLVVQTGTTHNGSGTIGGVTSSAYILEFFGGAGDALPIGQEFPLLTFGDQSRGYFGFTGWTPLNASTARDRWYLLERNRDVNGTPTGSGMSFLTSPPSIGDNFHEYINFQTSSSVRQDQWLTLYSPGNRSYGTYNGRKLIGRVYPNDGQAINIPLVSCMVPLAESVPIFSTFNYEVNTGDVGTYYVTSAMNNNAGQASRLAVRID